MMDLLVVLCFVHVPSQYLRRIIPSLYILVVELNIFSIVHVLFIFLHIILAIDTVENFVELTQRCVIAYWLRWKK